MRKCDGYQCWGFRREWKIILDVNCPPSSESMYTGGPYEKTPLFQNALATVNAVIDCSGTFVVVSSSGRLLPVGIS